MKNINIIYKNSIKKNFNLNLSRKYTNIFNKIKLNIDKSEDIFHSLSKNFNFNFKIKDLRQFKKFKTIIVVGMGGSILGSEAIHCFLKKKIKKNVLFLNNINQEKLKENKNKKREKKTLFIIISKSGSTIETLSNFFALKVIKKNSKNIIIISEKNNKSLYLISQKMKLFFIEHKKYIGGRFSVLSEVGIVPAYLMGIDIKKLRKNLLIHLNNKNKSFLRDSVIKLTSLLKKKKFKNIIFFNYVPQLNKFLYWNQQLIAESLGKNGGGFFPSISTAPKDHHSLLQLYLDGPRDKIFYIFSSDLVDKEKIIIKNSIKQKKFLNKKSLSQIKKAQKNAFIKTLIEKDIPFREFTIKNYNEVTLGELFSYFILETVIIGKLFKINPFNQPAVEKVKTYTKNLLV